MIRSFARNAFVAGAIGLSWSAGHPALAGSPEAAIPPGKPVQSNASTASAGRRPLAVRIAMADKVKAEAKAERTVAIVKAAAAQPPADDAAVAPAEVAAAEPAPSAAPDVAESTAAESKAAESKAAESNAAERPAVPRLLIDCEESTIDARHGEKIRWRITIRNAGAAAHHVVATLYFAQGIEPTAAVGRDHTLASGEARFSPVETLGPDDAIQLEVTGHAVQPGAVAYRIEVGCREFPGHVAREAVILVRPKAAE